MLGTNGGGFFNTNSAHPFENPTGFTNFFEMLTVLVIPAALVFMYGRMAGNRRQGYAIYATMMVMFLGAASRRVHRRGARVTGPARRRPAHAGARGLDGRKHGGQGAAVRDRRLRAVRRGHDGHLVRRGQQRDRVVHRHRRRGPDGQPVGERGDLRWRRHRAVLDPPVRPAGGVHRRADGRTNARVSGQEDRGQGDQAGRDRVVDHAAGGAVLDRARDREQRRTRFDLGRRDGAAGVLGDLLRLPVAGQQQRLGVRGLHRLHSAQRRQRRLARRHVRGPPRRLHDAVRPLRPDPVRARRRRQRSPASGSAPPASGRCAPTTRRSWCC